MGRSRDAVWLLVLVIVLSVAMYLARLPSSRPSAPRTDRTLARTDRFHLRVVGQGLLWFGRRGQGFFTREADVYVESDGDLVTGNNVHLQPLVRLGPTVTAFEITSDGRVVGTDNNVQVEAGQFFLYPTETGSPVIPGKSGTGTLEVERI